MNESHLDPDRAGLWDEHEDNSIPEQAFSDYESLAELYRVTYKYTPCGPHVSALVEFYETIDPYGFNDYPSERHVSRWVHCHELQTLGTWENMAEKGILLRAIMVGSIVEGVDFDTDNIEVPCQPDGLESLEQEKDTGDLWRTLRRVFNDAVKSVNDEANSIWHRTHGCEGCANHWHSEGITEGEWGPFEGSDGVTPIWLDCPECDGAGTII